MNTDETELQRLREENRHLRRLLAAQTAEAADTGRRYAEAQSAEQEQALETIAGTGAHKERMRRLYETVLSSTPDLVYVFDRTYRFTFANDALLHMWGRTLEDAVGKSLLEIGYEPWHAQMHEREIDQVIATRQALRGEVPFPHATLGRRIYDYIFVPVLGADGEVEAVVGTTRDVTEGKRAEAALRESEERVRLATEAAGLGVWTWEPATDGVVWENARMFAIYGLSPDDPPLTSTQFLAECVHPDDIEAFARAIAVPGQTGEPLHFVGRFYRRDGALRWIEFRGRRPSATAGERLRVVGTASDITERKEAEQQLHARAKEIEGLNERLRRAMRETHHRVKNNLQVISAMAEMQTDGSASVPATALQRIGLHARNLATLHDLLTQEATRHPEINMVSARSALNKLAPLLQDVTGGRAVECASDELALPVTECSSLTMLVSELVSNAFKHGAGSIAVSLRRMEERTTLQVCDEGAGFPPGFDPTRDANTGLELILMLARHDLRGSIAFENAPGGGACVTVAFPL